MGRKSLIIVDSFYPNPDQIRENALKAAYNPPGYKTKYPGIETQNLEESALQPLMQSISNIIGHQIGWNNESPQGIFRIVDDVTGATRDNLVHVDPTRWSGVIYLTLPEHCAGGTSFYKHKETGLTRLLPEPHPEVQNAIKSLGMSHEQLSKLVIADSLNLDKWEETDRVTMMYNRLILFDGGKFHGVPHVFGKSRENSRLTQHFFFNEVIKNSNNELLFAN